MSDQEADLEALTISFAGLDITVRRRASRTARSEDFVLVEAPSFGPRCGLRRGASGGLLGFCSGCSAFTSAGSL